jgi:hypothetical protein
MARNFNQTVPRKYVATIPTIPDATPFSLAIWLKVNAQAGDFPIFFNVAKSTATGVPSCRMAVNSNTAVIIQFYRVAGGGGPDSGQSNPTFTIGPWYHFAITCTNSSASNGVRGYSNGNNNPAWDSPLTGSMGDVMTVAGIGEAAFANFSSNGDQFILADAAIWSAVLTPSEVLSLAMVTQRPGQVRPQSLIYWAPLDGYGAATLDRSIYKNSNAVQTGTIPFAPGPPRISDAPIINTSLTDPSYVMPPGVMPMVPPPAFVLMPQILW